MAEEVSQKGLMTEGSIAKIIITFSIPLILGNLLQQLYNAADSVIVSNFNGSNALAAVSSSSSLISLLIAFSQGAAVGTGVVVSQYLGARNRKGVHDAVHTAVAIAMILGVVLTIGGILLSRPLLVWMDTPAAVLGDAATYLRIFFGGVFFNVLYNMCAGILNSAGNSRRSLFYLFIASMTNIALDLILVGIFDMGVAGAAIATDISQFMSSTLALRFLMRCGEDYGVDLRQLRLRKSMVARIVKVGLPTGFQNMIISFSNVLVQSSVNAYGPGAMAGFGAYMKIDGFNILPVMSFSMAATTFVGQNYGAGKLDRVKRGVWVTLGLGMCYTLATGALLLVFSEPIMRLFNDDPTVIGYGQLTMRYFCPFYFLLSILHGLAGAVRGTGKSIPPMVVLLASLCLFRIAWIKLILPLIPSLGSIFLLYPVSWAFGAVLMVLYAWKGKWLVQH